MTFRRVGTALIVLSPECCHDLAPDHPHQLLQLVVVANALAY